MVKWHFLLGLKDVQCQIVKLSYLQVVHNATYLGIQRLDDPVSKTTLKDCGGVPIELESNIKVVITRVGNNQKWNLKST